MAQPYVTGPAPIWISANGSSVPQFLGHAERTPRIQFKPHYGPLWCDLGGHEVPFDLVLQGTEAMVSIDMTRFNESTYSVLQTTGKHQGTVFGDLGTLMMTENAASKLWIPWPYKTLHAAMATMYAGFQFLTAVCINDDIDMMGTMPRRQRLVWHCIRKFDPATYNHVLCNQDLSALPPGVPG